MVFPETLLQTDPLGRVFVMAFVLVGIPCLLYMLSLQKDLRLAAVSVGFIAAAMGVVLARDFLWFLIFWELTVLLACCLILYERKPSSFAVMYRYFLIQLVAGTSLFFAIAMQYAANGSFEISAIVPEARPFFLVAFLTKAAVVPVHVWVPLTYPSVPPAVAVILSAYSTKVGVYAFARLMPGIPWLAYAGAFMALFGVAMALRQKTARRLLSYHLISQVGYMIAGIGLGSDLGVGGGVLHMMHNLTYKTLLFMVAGAVIFRTGNDVLARVRGAGRAMPLTFTAALVAAAAISGLPPLNGYVSKTLLKASAEGHVFLLGALLLAGIGTTLSFTKFIWYLFLHGEPSDAPASAHVKEMPLGACVAMGMLTVLCFAQGVAYPRFFALAQDTVSESVYTVGGVLMGAATVFGGIALFVLSRAISQILSGRTATRTEAVEASARRRTSTGRAFREEAPPWDADVVYAWLLHRVVRVSQWIARRAKDETQAYILVITVLLVMLVVYCARP